MNFTKAREISNIKWHNWHVYICVCWPRSQDPECAYLATLMGSNPSFYMANRKVLSHHVVINCLEWSPSFHTSNSQPTDLRWQFSAQSYLLNPLGSLLIWTLIYERRRTMYDFHNSTDTLKFWTEKRDINKTFLFFIWFCWNLVKL